MVEALDEDTKMALAFDVAIDAAVDYRVSKVVDALLGDPTVIDLILNEDAPEKLQQGSEKIRLIRPKSWDPLGDKESATVAVACPRTAALFFDRVWCMDDQAPTNIGLRFGALEEDICLGLVNSLVGKLASTTDADDKKMAEVARKLSSVQFEVELAQRFESMILAPVKRMSGRDVSVFSASQAACREVYGTGERKGALAVLEGVPLIEETSLTWEQVSELRADMQSRRKLTRFLHWVEKEFVDRPPSVIREGIEHKLADYEDALKKHGIQRSLGRVSVLLDGGLWWAVASAFEHTLAGLVGIGVMGFKAAVTHYKYRMIQSDLASQNPVAYIYEVISRTQSEGTPSK